MNINGVLQMRTATAMRQASVQRQKASERLSSGSRINSAADDAAGLGISVSMASQIRGAHQGLRNIADGISLAQVAQGALASMSENLQRIRELAVQAANGTYSNEQRAVIQTEVAMLRDGYMDTMLSTQFNGIPLMGDRTPLPPPLLGSVWGPTTVAIQAGPDAGDVISGDFGLSFLPVFDVSTGNASVISDIDDALEETSTLAANYGAFESRLESAANGLISMQTNLSDAHSRIADAQYDSETVSFAKAAILENAASAMMAQANVGMRDVLTLLR